MRIDFSKDAPELEKMFLKEEIEWSKSMIKHWELMIEQKRGEIKKAEESLKKIIGV